MAITLYDATARTFSQVVEGLSGVLAKGEAHFAETGVDLADVVKTRLAPDMLPLTYQIQAAIHHSIGAIEAIETGVFTPEMPFRQTYAELQASVAKAHADLAALSPDAVNALEGRDVVFRFGEREMPYYGGDFLMTFSVPNFFFHATTAYDILRHRGVPLAKRDYLGTPRMKT